MLLLGSLPSERSCLHMVPGTLAYSMNRGGMRCGLRLRVLGWPRAPVDSNFHHQLGRVVTVAVGFSPAIG